MSASKRAVEAAKAFNGALFRRDTGLTLYGPVLELLALAFDAFAREAAVEAFIAGATADHRHDLAAANVAAERWWEARGEA